ncbi:DNA-binding transcriptional MocR family regulator [Actinoplanes campanulatus]|uniref:DNA-binding transcriptional MocR family regulator n=1 Tax=Actinoplanes campanulatus TaxID=113559 RepID=A0A7W5AKX2_9ACTN|nr:PLP-dependent aminotransferase family protein [Actinoplanes campanulatus]MBB3098158.1 DNA-binding transcriptional MocR family regulator [Actinoplanes campanulatus]GGN32700.1 putative GntR-family regulatory protein [Actinoplanes campanulatus]GID39968.1 putative GntR-family regulatory protein [Actinoplanes campanulatus]
MPEVPESGFAALLGGWRQVPGPLAGALATAVRSAVVDGRIPVGTRLPSERALAAALRVSRGTVVTALATLRDAGWLRTRHGSGSAIRLPPSVTGRTAPWSVTEGDGLDLTRAVPAAPHAAYLEASRRAVQRSATLLVDAAEPDAGLPRLRELLADRYSREGLPTRPEQILVTSGARAALTLLADHLADPVRPILVESPTYHGALGVLRRRHTRFAAVPMTSGGWDADRLARTVRAARPALAYVTPDFHNPTGALMPPELRAGVADLAARHDMTVIVDETLRDLDLRDPPGPIPHLAGPGVVTIGSTSKLVWGGLRVGWIRAAASRVRELRLNPLQARLAPPPLEQLIACELLSDPGELLRDRRDRLRAQRDHLAGLLDGAGDWSFTLPPGGLCLWLRLHGADARTVATRAAGLGLRLSPGPVFSADGTLTRHLRIPFTGTPEILTRAVGLLARAVSG